MKMNVLKTLSSIYKLILLDDENVEDLSKKREVRRINRRKLTFYFLGLPTLVSFIYFYGVGRDRYFVRSDVVIRKGTNNTPSISLLNIISSGNNASQEDSKYLKTYLESPQVLSKIEKQIDFPKVFKKKGMDLYAGIDKNVSKEKKYTFFRKQISTQLDEASGVFSIRTLAYEPKVSFFLNKFLLKESLDFVNKLNHDIYKEQLDFILSQVKVNAQKVKIAKTNLAEYQKNNEFLDAEVEASNVNQYIVGLEAELVSLKIELATLKNQFIDSNAPEIKVLENQVSEIKRQIELERKSLVNPQGKNFNKKIIQFLDLKYELEFANKLYQSSLTAAEKTRVDSIQQQRFMAILREPREPQDAWMYWRHKGFLTTIAILIVGFSLTKFMMGMADSHRN